MFTIPHHITYMYAISYKKRLQHGYYKATNASQVYLRHLVEKTKLKGSLAYNLYSLVLFVTPVMMHALSF